MRSSTKRIDMRKRKFQLDNVVELIYSPGKTYSIADNVIIDKVNIRYTGINDALEPNQDKQISVRLDISFNVSVDGSNQLESILLTETQSADFLAKYDVKTDNDLTSLKGKKIRAVYDEEGKFIGIIADKPKEDNSSKRKALSKRKAKDYDLFRLDYDEVMSYFTQNERKGFSEEVLNRVISENEVLKDNVANKNPGSKLSRDKEEGDRVREKKLYSRLVSYYYNNYSSKVSKSETSSDQNNAESYESAIRPTVRSALELYFIFLKIAIGDPKSRLGSEKQYKDRKLPNNFGNITMLSLEDYLYDNNIITSKRFRKEYRRLYRENMP